MQIDWTEKAIKELDINKLPDSLKEPVSKLLQDAIAKRNAITRKIYNADTKS